MGTKLNKLFKLAESLEKKYERSDKDPDELSWEDTDPRYFGYDPDPEPDYDSEISPKRPTVSWETAQSIMTQLYPHFIALNPEDQEKVLKNLTQLMRRTK